MRTSGVLGPADYAITRLQGLGLTDAQRTDAVHYQLGCVVQFHKRVSGGFKVGEKWQVVGNDSRSVVVQLDGQQRRLPLNRASSFEVYSQEHLSIAIGDPLRITKNFKCAGKAFRNNQVVTVTAIEEGKIRTREGEIVIRGGLHLDQGIAVTSHAAQGKTVDQVIVSAPVESFSQVSQEQLYVSMSRARQQMHLVTDNKVALRSAVTRTSKRLSPWELINDADQERVMSPVIEQTEVDLQAGKKTKEKTREPELSPLALALARLAWESPNKHESQQPEPPRQSIEQERGVSYDR